MLRHSGSFPSTWANGSGTTHRQEHDPWDRTLGFNCPAYRAPAPLGHHAIPIAGPLLTEQPRGRIPRAVVAIQQPAPVGAVLQHDPHRLAQRTGEMRHRRIDRHHQIEQRDQRRGVGDSRPAPRCGRSAAGARQPVALRRRDLLLQRVQLDPEIDSTGSSVSIGSDRLGMCCEPHQASPMRGRVARTEALLPCREPFRRRAQIRDLRRHRCRARCRTPAAG